MQTQQDKIDDRAPSEQSSSARIELLFQMIEFAQEIGRPGNAAHYIKRIEAAIAGSADAAATRERLSAARAWLAWAEQYEKINGKESLLDRRHPVHLRALAKLADPIRQRAVAKFRRLREFAVQADRQQVDRHEVPYLNRSR